MVSCDETDHDVARDPWCACSLQAVSQLGSALRQVQGSLDAGTAEGRQTSQRLQDSLVALRDTVELNIGLLETKLFESQGENCGPVA